MSILTSFVVGRGRPSRPAARGWAGAGTRTAAPASMLTAQTSMWTVPTSILPAQISGLSAQIVVWPAPTSDLTAQNRGQCWGAAGLDPS